MKTTMPLMRYFDRRYNQPAPHTLHGICGFGISEFFPQNIWDEVDTKLNHRRLDGFGALGKDALRRAMRTIIHRHISCQALLLRNVWRASATSPAGRGLSQEKLAAKARLSREYVSQLERNEKSPTLDTLLKICGAMGMKPSELLGRAGL